MPQTPEITVVDTIGYKYRLIQPEKVLSNNILQVELWERIDPLDTNRWYTPTLASKLYTNNPPLFNSISR